jgi:hypothetical protein
VFEVKRLILALIVGVVLLLPSSALADRPTVTVERFPADFVLSWQTCPNLPAGTTVTGTGTGTSITTERTARGITRVSNTSFAFGRATDQAGNSYRFLYSNRFRVANTTATPGLYSGVMVDLFVLRGNGPVSLRNGFVARITTDLGESFTFDPISEFGNPLDFATGQTRCDPL